MHVLPRWNHEPGQTTTPATCYSLRDFALKPIIFSQDEFSKTQDDSCQNPSSPTPTPIRILCEQHTQKPVFSFIFKKP